MNWSEFFSMGGYAFYVWGSYISALLVLGGEVVLLMRRQKALRNRAGKGAHRIR
jgi:heme exporter protein D